VLPAPPEPEEVLLVVAVDGLGVALGVGVGLGVGEGAVALLAVQSRPLRSVVHGVGDGEAAAVELDAVGSRSAAAVTAPQATAAAAARATAAVRWARSNGRINLLGARWVVVVVRGAGGGQSTRAVPRSPPTVYG
jgi:hypothetical protein